MFYVIVSTAFKDIAKPYQVGINVSFRIFQRISNTGLGCEIDDDVKGSIFENLVQLFTI